MGGTYNFRSAITIHNNVLYIFLYLVGNIFAFQEGNIFAFQEANFVSTVKPMFSDVGDTNKSATMFLTFDEGFSLKKNI